MPNRGYGDWYTAIHFRCNNEMPHMIYRACQQTHTVSQTRYVQEAVATRLATDLNLDETYLLSLLPPTVKRSKHLFHPAEISKHPNRMKDYDERIGGRKTIEEVT